MDDSLLAGYRLHQERRGLAPRTIAARDQALRRYLRHSGKGFRESSAEDIERWLDSVGGAPKYRSWLVSHVSCLYTWAVKFGHLSDDPTIKVVRPKIRRSLPRPLSADDMRVAVDLAPPTMRAWLLLGCLAGLRCKEIAGLDRCDVNDAHKPPMLRVMGKGDHERLVPMHPLVVDALRSHGLPRRGKVFTGQHGVGTSADVISKQVARYLRSIGVEATAHQLRHTFATNVYAETHDLRTTQELMGHMSPQVTAIYAAWDQAESVAAVARLTI